LLLLKNVLGRALHQILSYEQELHVPELYQHRYKYMNIKT